MNGCKKNYYHAIRLRVAYSVKGESIEESNTWCVSGCPYRACASGADDRREGSKHVVSFLKTGRMLGRVRA